MKTHRNPVLKGFSADLRTTFLHLDEICDKTAESRMELITREVVSHHTSDNYQEYHPFDEPREHKAGIMHTGMVFNIVPAWEFHKSPGTIICDKRTGLLHKVVSCIMNNYSDCLIIYRPHNHKVESTAAVMNTDRVHLPSLAWQIVSLPGQEQRPAITYLDQHIPASVNMRVSMVITVKDMMMDDRSHWNSIVKAATRSVSCRDYHSAILATLRTIEF